MDNTKISKCTCVNEFQDERYGKHKRVFNRCKQTDLKSSQYRCTACGNTKG